MLKSNFFIKYYKGNKEKITFSKKKKFFNAFFLIYIPVFVISFVLHISIEFIKYGST